MRRQSGTAAIRAVQHEAGLSLPGLRIRLAGAEERDALEALQRRASLALPDYRDALLAYPEAIHLPADLIAAGRVLVAEDDGAVAGFAAWTGGAAADEAELDGLFVEPARWRGGFGRALVEAVATEAARAGKARMTVVANPSALAFYLSCGFAEIGPARTRFGPALLLARPLFI